MEEDDPYESLPPTTTMSTHMVAGAAAGIMEHVVMYPVDCVKTRMQCLVPDPNANYRSVIDALYRIVRHEGYMYTVRGINVVMYGAGPAHALYFAMYEKVKHALSKPHRSNHLVHGIAGIAATVMHDAVMTPIEVIKQRMQIYNSPYKTCTECGRTVLRLEGMHAFYRSYFTQLVMNVPFQALHFVTYEECQDWLNPDRQYNPLTHMVSGGLAGAVAAYVTSPLDVCKTLLNTQEKCAIGKGKTSVSGLFHAFKVVYTFRGMAGFFSGSSARIIYQVPSTAISWSVYEFFKFAITRRNEQGDGYLAGSEAVMLHAAAPTPEVVTTVAEPVS
ncbi:hypothetical protein NP493_726g01065 [Ridgeia piscesae]|uniref:Mitochondrial carrier protein n=1 Tax=Ridgeia piscesae TaxID=27915 RepID=A0AAD9KQR6_RIDPI|nr:hypothetical protein NP493_726g01065 [Ridgeia piscesae]